VLAADRGKDILTPNHAVCPKLSNLEEEAYSSPEYKAFNSSENRNEIRHILYNELKVPVDEDDSMLDCLMTTICTDRILPDILDDFSDDNDNSIFNRAGDFDAHSYTFPYMYNESRYARLAMGPMWVEILDPLKQTMSVEDLDGMTEKQIPRLTLFSAHDTTIMPLLASLGRQVWDGKWTPYASMLVVESHILTTPHNDFPSNYAFRLLYNGQVLTSKIENCSGDLCDLKVLLDLIEPFARLNRDCDSIESSIMTNTSSGQSVAAVSLPVMLVYTFLCCILSSVVTFFFTTGRLPLCNIRKLLKKHGKAAYGTFSPPSLSAQAESPNPSGIGGFQIESVKRGQNDETKLQESTHETLPSSRPDCANEHGSREVL